MGYEKAVLIPEDGKKEIKVQFNPAEYNLSRSTTYAEKKVLGLDDPFTQYIAGEAETLKITLMFDTYILPVFLRKTPMRHETCALAFAI